MMRTPILTRDQKYGSQSKTEQLIRGEDISIINIRWIDLAKDRKRALEVWRVVSL